MGSAGSDVGMGGRAVRRDAAQPAKETFATLDLDSPGQIPTRPYAEVTLGEMLVHMVDETARHAGHMDIVRESIDGAVGRYAGDGNIIDGYDWVMAPNVLGMATWADGGRMMTKPYAASGRYVDRMSDHCAHCVYQPGVRTGDDACPHCGAGFNPGCRLHRHLYFDGP